VVSRYNRGFFPVARPDDPDLGARDFLGADCERVGYEFEDSLGTLPAHPRLTKRGDPYFRLSCPATEDGLLPCKEIVTLRRDAPHHTLVARGATPTGPWRDHRVTAHLTTRGRRLATRPRGVRTTVRIVLQAQRSYRLGWTIRLRVPHVPRSHP
jgi:hypothetical protein